MFGSPPRTPVPAWDAAVLAADWQRLAEASRKLVDRSTSGSAFEERMRYARQLLEAGDAASLSGALTEPRMVRAIITSWVGSTPLAERTLRRETLEAIRTAGTLNRMAAESLLGLLLRHFERLEAWQAGLFDAMASLIRATLSKLDPSRRTAGSLTETARLNPSWFLEKDGPKTVAAHIRAQDQTLETFLGRSALRAYEVSAYAGQVKRWLFLEQIRTADRGTAHAFLGEITQPAVYEAPMPGAGYFGHQLIEALVGAGDKPTGEWIDAILDIGGDPRMTHTGKWAAWWASVPRETADAVKKWLSTEDLRLFLAAVEAYGKRSGDPDIQRMFPDRQRFMEGLLKLGLVRETRLILGEDARQSVRAHLGTSLKSDFATLSRERERSIIYIDCGDFHIVEGSHNFKIWTYVGRPGPMLANRSKVRFSGRELREGVPREFMEANDNNYNAFDGFSHQGTENATWQFKVVALLEHHGITLDYHLLVTPDALQRYVQRQGLRR